MWRKWLHCGQETLCCLADKYIVEAGAVKQNYSSNHRTGTDVTLEIHFALTWCIKPVCGMSSIHNYLD